MEQTEYGGVAAGLINTSQEAGGALGLAIVSTVAFRRVPELTQWAHGDANLVRTARATVFHEAFLAGACLLAIAFVVALLFLPMLRARAEATPESTAGSPLLTRRCSEMAAKPVPNTSLAKPSGCLAAGTPSEVTGPGAHGRPAQRDVGPHAVFAAPVQGDQGCRISGIWSGDRLVSALIP